MPTTILLEGVKLVPFALSQLWYWSHDAETRQTNIRVKCLPILCLAIYLLCHRTFWTETNSGRFYPIRLLFGLLYCGIGDAVLTFPHHFVKGVLFFGIGHAVYAASLGGRKRNVMMATAVVVLLFVVATCVVTVPCLRHHERLFYPCVAYQVVVGILLWVVVARVDFGSSGLPFFAGMLSMIGVLVFALSDALLIFSITCSRFRHDNVLVMCTYYTAQLFIALGSTEALLAKGKLA